MKYSIKSIKKKKMSVYFAEYSCRFVIDFITSNVLPIGYTSRKEQIYLPITKQ